MLKYMKFAGAGIAALAVALVTVPAQSADFRCSTAKLIVPWKAGGGTHVIFFAEATDMRAPGGDGQARGRGWIEVICGSMFSGKSEELIRRLRRAEIARQKVQVFKPRIDDRFDEDHIVSHSRQRISSQRVTTSAELYAAVEPGTRVVGIDEAQFYDDGLLDVCQRLASEGRRVIIAGLDQDYLGRPFEPIPQLLAVAEYITKTLAICIQCGAPANHSQRLIASEERVVVGAEDVYEARCRACFDPDLHHQ